MTNFSPVTQAVYDAAMNTPEHWCYEDDMAAMLRAVADQLVPEDLQEAQHFTNEAIRLNRMGIRQQLLAIANELQSFS